MTYEVLSPQKGLVAVSEIPDLVYPYPVTKDFREPLKREPKGLPYQVLGELGTDFQSALFELCAYNLPPGDSRALRKVGQDRPGFKEPLITARSEVVHQAARLINPPDAEKTRYLYSEVALEPSKSQRESIFRSYEMIHDGFLSMDEAFPFIAMLAADSVNTTKVLRGDDSHRADDLRTLAGTPFHIDPYGQPPCYLPGRLDIVEVVVKDVDEHTHILTEAIGKTFQGENLREKLLDIRKLNDTEIKIGNKSFSSLEVLQETFSRALRGEIEINLIEVKSALNTYQKDKHELGKELGAYLLMFMRLAENILPKLSVPENMDKFIKQVGASAVIMGCKIVPSKIEIPGHPFVDELVEPTNIYAQRFDYSQSEKMAYIKWREQKVHSHLRKKVAEDAITVAA